MTTSRNLHAAAGMILVALIASACSDNDTDPPVTTEPEITAPDTAPTTEATTTTSPPTTTTEPDTTTTLPGEEMDFGPAPDDVLAVIGVEHDDVLNVRSAPGADHPVVATLSPTADDAVATGHTRSLDDSIWTEITVDDATGWANLSFLAYLGDTNDTTAEIIDRLEETPGAETMLELGSIVAEVEASEEPPSTVTVTVAPTVGDLGEIVMDVVGLGDDALRGLRLHVFGEPLDDGETFLLRTVETTVLCGRGVADGLCL